MTLARLLEILIDSSTFATEDYLCRRADASKADLRTAVREGVREGYVEVRRSPGQGRVVQLTPLGAGRLNVTLVEVEVCPLGDGDFYLTPSEVPRWVDRDLAKAIASGRRKVLVPDDEAEEARFVGMPDNRLAEPIEYLIAAETVSQEAEKRRGIDNGILPYPAHFVGMDEIWPIAVDEPDEDRASSPTPSGYAQWQPEEGTICEACGNRKKDILGYCLHCDRSGVDRLLPAVRRRPKASRLTLDGALAGGTGPRASTGGRSLVEQFKAKRKAERQRGAG